MPENHLFVFAKVSPKHEYFEQARQAIVNILHKTREEPGCRQFELYDSCDEKRLFLYEEWESESALQAHYQKPYTLEVFANYQKWLAYPVEIEKMSKCVRV